MSSIKEVFYKGYIFTVPDDIIEKSIYFDRVEILPFFEKATIIFDREYNPSRIVYKSESTKPYRQEINWDWVI
jgi:hypothetical protein